MTAADVLDIPTLSRRGTVLVVSAAAPQEHVLNAVAAGAKGYLGKDAQPGVPNPTEITPAISITASGRHECAFRNIRIDEAVGLHY